MARSNTAVSNIMVSCIVMLTLLVITALFKYTSNAILASIIIPAVLCLIHFDAAVLLWKINKFDFLACCDICCKNSTISYENQMAVLEKIPPD
ncbi:hypothetical protein L2E82_24874 [Cichorium intybus]|uniref:Uncharacterized protein n=1 Tax=Cichorium intybus TaxID=13427 RepID=A0ACB9E238_CICIN|nr:hypothetical protein L2E82_24874 [Cichorium intybus]